MVAETMPATSDAVPLLGKDVLMIYLFVYYSDLLLSYKCNSLSSAYMQMI